MVGGSSPTKTVSQARNNTPACRSKFQILGAEQNKNVAPGRERVENEFKGGSHVKSLMNPRRPLPKRGLVRFRWFYGPDSPGGQSREWARDELLSPVDLSNGRINALVCMFNSFALAGPFCERMKIQPSGEFGCRTCCAVANAAIAWGRQGGYSVQWGRSAATCFAPPWARF